MTTEPAPTIAPLSLREAGRELLPRLVLPGLVVALIAAAAVAGLESLSENPFRLTIFYYLFRTDESAAALVYSLSLLLAFFLCIRIPAVELERKLVTLGERPWLFLGLVFVLLAAATLLVYRDHPLSMDEYAALFQAEVFAAGRLFGSFPPPLVPWLIPEFFVNVFFAVSDQGQVFSRYLPGFSLLLAPFVKLGAPWLLNPLLVVAVLLLLRSLCRRLLPGTSAAGWAMLLAIASPQVTAYGISFYSMTAHLCANLLFALLLLRPTSAPRLVAAGLVGSFALALHQPLPHFLFALPWIVWLAIERRGRIKRLALLGLGYLPLTLLLVVGSYALQSRLAGEPTGVTAGIVATFLASVESAFTVPNLWVLGSRLLQLLLLFLWAVPGLPMLALLGLRLPTSGNGTDRSKALLSGRLFGLSLLLTLTVLLVVSYDQGHGWGHRYAHSAWCALPLLAALYLASSPRRRTGWVQCTGLLVLLAFLLATPLRLLQIRSFIDRHLAQLPPVDESWPGSVLFLDVHRGYYTADLVQNDPFLRNRHWILVSHGREADEALIRTLAPDARLVRDNGSETQWVVDWPDLRE